MKIDEKSPTKIRIVTALLLFGVFASGVITGAGLFHWLNPPPFFRPPRGLPGPFSELGLSKEQEEKVVEIFEKHRPKLDAILQQTFPKARKVFDAIDQEVRTVLTAEQKKKFDTIKREKGPFPPIGSEPPFEPHGPPPFGPPGGPPFGPPGEAPPSNPPETGR